MPIDEILISAMPGDRRAAARSRGTLVRLIFDADSDEPRPGDLRRGRIVALAPAIGGAFVDIGAQRHGLLMRADAPAGRALAEGEALVVRVTRSPDGDKGAKLDARLSDNDVAATASAAGAPGLIKTSGDPIADLLRGAAGEDLRQVVIDDPSTLSALRAAVPEVAGALRYWGEAAPLFAAEGVDEAIEAALAAQVPLPSGGRLHIEETAAVAAIDVDTGAFAGASARAAALACDLEAAAEIGRQIVLRDLAGLIVIDFVPLRRPAERERVLAVLRDALAGDDRQMRIGGWTRLGLLEMVRERRGPSLRRRLTAACPSCAGLGAVGDARWVAGDALRAVVAERRDPAFGIPALVVSPAVAAALRGPLAAARRQVEERLGCPVTLQESALLPAGGFRLTKTEACR
ncbi:MAG: ribonuclease E/G [Rhodospirillales bacterium]|nr:ribonuclease E/G [Rhodospirillales bacterium]